MIKKILFTKMNLIILVLIIFIVNLIFGLPINQIYIDNKNNILERPIVVNKLNTVNQTNALNLTQSNRSRFNSNKTRFVKYKLKMEL